MAIKKLSAFQSLLKHKFALLVAVGAVTALFVVFAAFHTTGTSRFLANGTTLKPNTASANLAYGGDCYDAFWDWWMSGDDDDYYAAAEACSGGGGGGDGAGYGGDYGGDGGWPDYGDDCSSVWDICDDGWGDDSDGPPFGTCYPGYNMDATGYCYPNGGVDDACHNPIGIDFEECDPTVPYDPTPTLCSDPYYAAMNINECGVVNVPDDNDPFNCDEINDDCLYSPNPPPPSDNGNSSCRSANGFPVTCSDGFHCDTVNGGCAPDSPITTDGDPDGCDETHDNCMTPPPPTPPDNGIDEHGCTRGFGYFERGGVWGCYDISNSAERCADVNYALNNKTECGVVDVPSGPSSPLPDPANPFADEIRRCEDGPGYRWDYVRGRCVAESMPDPCLTDLHYAAGHPGECTPTVAQCSDPYYAAGNPQCDGVVPTNPPPPSGNGVDEHGCTRGFTWRQDQYTGIWACYDSNSNPPPPPAFDEFGCSAGFRWESRNGVYACYDAGSSNGSNRQTTPTRDTGDACVDETGNSCDYTVPTDSTRGTGGGRSLWDRVTGPIRGLFGN